MVTTAESVVEEETGLGWEDHHPTPDLGLETSVRHPVDQLGDWPMVMVMSVTDMVDLELIRTMPPPHRSHK